MKKTEKSHCLIGCTVIKKIVATYSVGNMVDTHLLKKGTGELTIEGNLALAIKLFVMRTATFQTSCTEPYVQSHVTSSLDWTEE